jgi:hypothetical protein
VSFVVIGAFAPDSVAETGPAGPASLPLLFSVVPVVVIAGPASLPILFTSGQGVEVPIEPVPDPVLAFGDHSPDLLLFWEDHPFEGSEWIDHTADELVFADVSDSDISLTDHTGVALVFTDHTPD